MRLSAPIVWIAFVALAACRKESLRTASDAGASPAPPSTGYIEGRTMTLPGSGVPAPAESLGNGPWASFGPHGHHGVVRMTAGTFIWPGNRQLLINEIQAASFSADDEKLLLTVPDGFLVAALNDLHTLLRVPGGRDPIWTERGTIAFVRDDQVFETSPTAGAVQSLLGPSKPVTIAATRREISPDRKRWLLADDRRIVVVDLASSSETVLFEGETKNAVTAPDFSRACWSLGSESHHELRCATLAAPSVREKVLSVETPAPFAMWFLSATRLLYLHGGAMGLVDFDTRSFSTVGLANGQSVTQVQPLPGGQRVVVTTSAGIFGIMDLSSMRLVPILITPQEPWQVAGGSSDDEAFGIVRRDRTESVAGPLFRVKRP